MTGYDLTEAIEAADIAIHQGADAPCRCADEDLTAALTAALPHLEQQIREQVAAEAKAEALRDEYHTLDELYEYRMLYNALAANAMPDRAVKSWRHSDGQECFGGGWFVVYLTLPSGQVSNHYKAEHWDLFQVPEADLAPAWDGHTPAVAAQRLYEAVRADQIAGVDQYEQAWQSRDWDTVRHLQDEQRADQ